MLPMSITCLLGSDVDSNLRLLNIIAWASSPELSVHHILGGMRGTSQLRRLSKEGLAQRFSCQFYSLTASQHEGWLHPSMVANVLSAGFDT